MRAQTLIFCDHSIVPFTLSFATFSDRNAFQINLLVRYAGMLHHRACIVGKEPSKDELRVMLDLAGGFLAEIPDLTALAELSE